MVSDLVRAFSLCVLEAKLGVATIRYGKVFFFFLLRSETLNSDFYKIRDFVNWVMYMTKLLQFLKPAPNKNWGRQESLETYKSCRLAVHDQSSAKQLRSCPFSLQLLYVQRCLPRRHRNRSIGGMASAILLEEIPGVRKSHFALVREPEHIFWSTRK